MSTPRKPDLDQLVAALIADIRTEESAGRDAALAAFRDARQRGSAGRQRGAAFRRPFAGLSVRLAAIGTALVVAAGAAAAAYTQALPGPVQQLAHGVFAPLGVPDGPQSGPASPSPVPSTGPTGITTAKSGGASAPSKSPSHHYAVTVAVSRARVPANAVVAFTGRLTDGGRAAAGVRVRLYERVAGAATGELVATGLTGPRGGFRLLSPRLTSTAVFRILGPDNAHSVAVRITVSSPVSQLRLP